MKNIAPYKHRTKDQKGFSLVELLIVVVIIGILAAIAIPNLLASRRAANEGSAISTMRSYHTAQMTFRSTSEDGNYAGATGTDAFLELHQAGILDSLLGGQIKSGYFFTGGASVGVNGTPPTFWGACVPLSYFGSSPPPIAVAFFSADMSSVMSTGTRYFAVATDGIIYTESMESFGSMLPAPDDNGSFKIVGGQTIEGTPNPDSPPDGPPADGGEQPL